MFLLEQWQLANEFRQLASEFSVNQHPSVNKVNCDGNAFLSMYLLKICSCKLNIVHF